MTMAVKYSLNSQGWELIISLKYAKKWPLNKVGFKVFTQGLKPR